MAAGYYYYSPFTNSSDTTSDGTEYSPDEYWMLQDAAKDISDMVREPLDHLREFADWFIYHLDGPWAFHVPTPTFTIYLMWPWLVTMARPPP